MASIAFPTTAPMMPHIGTRTATGGRPLSLARISLLACGLIALLLMNKAGTAGNVVFFGVLTVMIAQGRERSFQALTLLFLGLICNQWYVPKNATWTIARFVIPALALCRFWIDMSTLKLSLLRYRFYWAHLVFIGAATVLTSLTGFFVPISLLKLLNYTIVTTALFSGIAVVKARKIDLAEWYVTLITVTAVLGLASLPLGIGYNAKPFFKGAAISVFNGPFYHSNTLGPFCGLMCLYLACVWLLGAYRNRLVCLPLLATLGYFMQLSQSRTAFATLVVGLAVLIALTFLLSHKGWLSLRLNVSRSTLIAAALAVGVSIVIIDGASGGGISRRFTAFLNKGGISEEIDVEQVLKSRQGKITQSWDNFQSSPLIGIGFEVSTDQWFRDNATIFYAPVEKGFLPTAILEQSGIIGAVFFVISLLALIGHLWSQLNVPGLVLLAGFLTLNLGEVMYFGVAGHGAFAWLLVAGGILLGDFTLRDLRNGQRKVPRPGPMNARSVPAAA